MRATSFILFLILFSGFIHGQNPLKEKMNFSVQNTPITKALNKLSNKSNIPFTYSSSFFEKGQKTTLNANNQSIENILSTILKETNISYNLVDNHLVFFKKPTPIPKKYTLSGYLKDSETGERLVAANVYSKEHMKGTVSNEYGFFSMTLPEGDIDLTVSYLGYTEFSKKINLSKNTLQHIELEPSLTLAEIIVVPNDSFLTTPLAGEQQLSMNHAKSMPDLGGESDIIRMVQLLPGVQSGADGFGGLYVRGGGVDQNLTMVDGVTIYNPMHLLGMFSIYNTDAVRSATFLKGGFPARYGGRSSSVFDVRTKEGNQNQFSGEAGIGLVTGKLRLEAPIFKNKGTILLAGRTNLTDFFTESVTKKFLQVDDAYERSSFVDFNAKFSYTFSPQDRIYLSYYSGGDEITTSDKNIDFDDIVEDFFNLSELESEMAWGNDIGALRWNHLFNEQLFSNTTLSFSHYTFWNRSLTEFRFLDPEEMEWEDDFSYTSFWSDLTDFSIKTDFDWVPSFQHHFKFGAGYTHHKFLSQPTFYDEFEDIEGENYDSLSIEELARFETGVEQLGHEYYGFIEDEIEITDKWTTNLGIRFTGFVNGKNQWVNLEPRVNSKYQISDKIHLTTSYSKMTQYLHLIGFTGFGLPGDIWAMSDTDLPPQRTWQSTLGVNFDLFQNLDFEIEGYYKSMENLIHLPADYDPYDDEVEFDQVELLKGTGRAYGIELLLKKEVGKTGGWLSYALSWSERQFDDLNLGNRYPFHQDRRHIINLVLYHRLTNHFEFGANFVYGSANPYFLVEGDLIFGELLPYQEDINPNGKRNNRRQSPYHRLDLGVKYNFGKGRFKHFVKAGVYNLYNHENIAYNQLSNMLFQDTEVIPISILGIRPSLSYSVQF